MYKHNQKTHMQHKKKSTAQHLNKYWLLWHTLNIQMSVTTSTSTNTHTIAALPTEIQDVWLATIHRNTYRNPRCLIGYHPLNYLQKSKVFDWLPSTELPTGIQDVWLGTSSPALPTEIQGVWLGTPSPHHYLQNSKVFGYHSLNYLQKSKVFDWQPSHPTHAALPTEIQGVTQGTPPPPPPIAALLRMEGSVTGQNLIAALPR